VTQPTVLTMTAQNAEKLQRRAAAALLARGVDAGDHVAFLASSTIDLLIVALAASRAGVAPVLLNPSLTEAERAPILLDSAPRLVLGDADLSEMLDGDREVDLGDVQCRPMHYTSGTSGQPKGVWGGFDAARAQAMVEDEQQFWEFDRDDRHVVWAPLYHSAPFRFASGTLLAGGSVVVPGKFSAQAFRAAVDEFAPSTTFVSPAHLQRIRAGGGLSAFAGFRLIAHAGAPCPVTLKHWAIEHAPRGTLWEFYGATEGQFTACGTDEWLDNPGTVGRARPGRALRVDESGVIWCRPPSFARFEYWRAPAKTAEAWDGPWFSVFDLGEMRGDYLFVNARRSDLIITGGVNVYPVEVERAISNHPDVHAVKVVGVPDDEWGQVVCAAVETPLTTPEIEAYARAILAPYKVPKQIAIVDQIPLNNTGKADLAALLELFEPRPAG
jgi:long-chain acyl-CoA synthetase